jgi:hypothetical protein
VANGHLTAQEAARILGVYRDRLPALAQWLDLGERGADGRWRFRPAAIARLAETGLVKPAQHGGRRPGTGKAGDG